MPEAIFNTSVYFKNVYEDSWITEPFSKEMIFFNASTCGNNCVKWILKIAEEQDITINEI